MRQTCVLARQATEPPSGAFGESVLPILRALNLTGRASSNHHKATVEYKNGNFMIVIIVIRRRRIARLRSAASS
jgi:hypothetical protein